MSAAYSLIQSDQAKKAATLLAHCLDWSALQKGKGSKPCLVCIVRGRHRPTHDDKTAASTAICLLASPIILALAPLYPSLPSFSHKTLPRRRTFFSHSRPCDTLRVLIVPRGLWCITITHWPSRVPVLCRTVREPVLHLSKIIWSGPKEQRDKRQLHEETYGLSNQGTADPAATRSSGCGRGFRRQNPHVRTWRSLVFYQAFAK